MRYYHLIFLLLTCAACLPEEPGKDIDFSLNDDTIQEIIRWQDERNTAKLRPFAQKANATYRYAAANAFASVQDSAALPTLYTLLQDNSPAVRQAAAYAIGQTAKNAQVDSLVNAFRTEPSRQVQAAILEAVGKTGDLNQLKNIANVKTYQTTDSLLLLGQARAIYRYMIRRITAPEGTTRMIELLQLNTPTQVQQIAGDYLRRAQNINLNNYSPQLIDLFNQQKPPQVKMFLASALGKTEDKYALDTLVHNFSGEKDYRVKINTIRALASFEYKKVRTTMLEALQDPNPHVAYTAASYLRNRAAKTDHKLFFQLAQDSTANWRVKAELYAAALNRTEANYFNTRLTYSNAIKTAYETTENPYEKGALLQALGNHLPNHQFITDAIFDSLATPVIKSYGIQALADMRSRSDFDQLASLQTDNTRQKIADTFQRSIESGDVAMIATVSGVLRNEKLNFRRAYPDTEFMKNALRQLQLPRDVEAYNELQRTLNFFGGNDLEQAVITPKHNHPINWKNLEKYGDLPTATLQTKRGDIDIELLTNVAPASVANFIQLADDGYFNGKNFHRIVPNFVAQGGCPRGDGWGSLPYSIRSEIGESYYDDEGYVGMASAGKDTECSQWFITHSPTQHLDGRYTIFGKVTRGMNLVHALEIGDVIESVVIR